MKWINRFPSREELDCARGITYQQRVNEDCDAGMREAEIPLPLMKPRPPQELVQELNQDN
jgi:hypothetical protein